MGENGEEVTATLPERDAAGVALDALDEFFLTVRSEHRVPDEEMLPIDQADLNNAAQVRFFLQMVVKQGRLS